SETAAITVTAVNDAPLADNASFTINEDNTYTFNLADFNYSDIDGDPFANIRITALPAAGTLYLNGVSISLNAVITAAEINANELVYIPAANASGNNYAQFNFQVSDGTTYSNAYTININVTAVNDAPVVSNAIANQNITAGVESSFQFASNTFSDVEGDSFTYSATRGDDNPLDSFISFNAGTRTFSFDPNLSSVGNYSVKVIATDSHGAANSTTFNFIIANPSDGNDGTDGANQLVGTSNADTIYGFGENDTVNGGLGDDTIYGGQGDDILIGGYGGDTINGGEGNDIIYADDQSFDPKSIAGSVLWLDASDRSVVTLDTNGKVITWADKSTLGGQDATQSNASYRPDYINVNNFNGRNAISFDGVNDYLEKVGALLNTQITADFTLYLVVNETVNQTANNVGYFATDNQPGEYGFTAYRSNQTWGTGYKFITKGTNAWTSDFINTSNTIENDASILNMTRFNNGSNMVIYEDGSSIGTDTGSGNIQWGSGTNTFTIGRKRWDTNSHNDVDIGEIILYNNDLSAANRALVDMYLSYKYGINVGGLGAYGVDHLTGNSGADQFIWTNMSHSGVGDGNRDIITDFSGSGADGDTINIEGVANSLVFNYGDGFIGNGYASSYYYQSGLNTILSIDFGGDKTADMEIQLSNTNINLTDSDVIVDTPTQNGTSGNDVLNGTASADIIYGRAGNDTINGNDGNDILQGHAGDDVISGGRGDDLLIGNDGNDILIGGFGGDTINGGAGNDIIYADNQRFSNAQTGMKLWLDGSDINANGTAFTNNTSVTTWYDKSGNNYNATAIGTVTYQATTNTINGRSVLTMNGDNVPKDYLQLAATTGTMGLTNSDYEVYIIAKTADSDIQFLISSTSLEDYEIHLNGGIGARAISDDHPSEYADIGASLAYTNGNAHLFSMKVNANQTYVGVNGVYAGPTATSNSARSAENANLRLGIRGDNTYDFDGQMAEVLIFQGTMTSANRAIVEEYLAYKYNVNLSGQSLGVDQLTGGTGNDTFIWTNASYSSATTSDQITDFKLNGDADKIELQFDETLYLRGDTGASATWGTQAGQMLWFDNGGQAKIQIDWGGDGVADFGIQLNNIVDASNLSSADFIFHKVVGTNNADTLTGGALDDVLNGAGGNDLLNGGAGADILLGGDGDDILILDLNDLTAASRIDGGAGTNDILRFDGSNQTLDLHANTTYNPIINIERIDLDPGNNTLTLDEADVAALSSTLYINGNDANDIVNVAKAGVTDWTDNGTTLINSITYHHYSLAGTNLYVQDGVTIHLNV
ncbi:MAG: putative Ig domain-containing protein, partial [Legionellales bacterium]|nr:putative Ig domain-containing protein [Legionellales bacterium]